jgi:signal transduction histidine kinase/CheY-like chemotaxis protein
MADISQIIKYDPGLCGSLLKIVNSALYALPRTVTSLDRALGMLGLNRVRGLVLSLSLPAMQKRRGADKQTRGFWKASVAGAVAARELSLLLRRPDPEYDMVAGLLRDVGFLILQEVHPDAYAQLCAAPPADFAKNQCEMEKRILGVHHAEISSYILRSWRLPDDLTVPIGFHHHPAHAAHKDQEIQDKSMLLYFAHLIGQIQVTPDVPFLVQSIVDLGRARYGLADKRLEAFLKPLQEKIEEVARLLNVDIGQCHDYPALVANTSNLLTSIVVETSVENLRMQEEKNQAEDDRRQAEQALRASEEQVRQSVKMEAVGRLAGGIAHDFNNILTVINGFSDMLFNMVPAGTPARNCVEQIRSAGNKAAALTKQLLAFSRKQVLQPVALDLNSVIANLSPMMSRLIGEQIEVVQKLDPGLKPVLADPGQIDQVLINLLLNSHDAMPQGGTIVIQTENVPGDRIEKHLKIAPAGSYVMVTFTDNGTGMDDEIKAHVFEPFFTTKANGKGTGLGLAMIYGIIKQSGGDIALESQQGQGTTFRIYLPTSDEAVRPSQPKAQRPPANATGTILVAEDDDAVRGIIRKTLESAGYTVLEASNGESALAIAKNHVGAIDLLLTDVIMPVMDGYELSKQLRAIRPQTKVCYVSGYVDDKIVPREALESGIAFLPKPFAPNALACRVHEVLSNGKGVERRGQGWAVSGGETLAEMAMR